MSEDFCKSSQRDQSAIACDTGVSEVHAGVDGVVHGVGEDGGDGDRGAGLDVARMGHQARHLAVLLTTSNGRK